MWRAKTRFRTGSSLCFWGKLLTQQNLGYVSKTVDLKLTQFLILPFPNSVS